MISKSARKRKVSLWDKVGLAAALGGLTTGATFMVHAEWGKAVTTTVFFAATAILLSLIAALTNIRAVHIEFGNKNKKKSSSSGSSND